MAQAQVYVRVKLLNAKAVEALHLAAATLTDLAEDRPWDKDIKRAARAARYAIRNLTVVTEDAEKGE